MARPARVTARALSAVAVWEDRHLADALGAAASGVLGLARYGRRAAARDELYFDDALQAGRERCGTRGASPTGTWKSRLGRTGCRGGRRPDAGLAAARRQRTVSVAPTIAFRQVGHLTDDRPVTSAVPSGDDAGDGRDPHHDRLRRRGGLHRARRPARRCCRHPRRLRQLDVVRDRLASYGGHEVKSLGDGLLLTFGSPRQAVAFGVACQRALGDSAPRVRIGVNTGEVIDLDDDPIGGAVNAAARIADRADGGDVLVSDVVRQLAGATPVVRFVDRGRVRLKGFTEPWQLWAAVDGTSPADGLTTIGRRVELAVMDELLTALATGTGRAVLIEGEAGIGKSHLLTSLAHAARAAGMTVIEVAADEIARRPGDVAHALAADERLPATHRSQLRDLLHRTAHDGDVEDLSYAVIERCADALEVLTRAAPVVLVAEDLHWADDLSLGVMRAAVQRTSSSTLAVVGALRPVPRPVLLDRVLETVVKVGGRHLRLGPLDELDVQALAAALTGAAPGQRLRDRLQATGGNPLFVSELLRSFDEEQHLRIEAGVAEISESAVPASLGATLIRRLSWLPEGTRDLLRLASLLGTSFTLTELSALTGRTVVEVASWLRDATLAGLVVGDGERLSFRHDLVREAVYDDMLPAERRDLHRAAGQALARAGAPLQQVAWQYSRGATTGDLEAVGWLVRAADEVVSVAPSAAIDLFESALALAPPTWADRSKVQAQLIEPLAWCGRFERAEELAASVLATSPDPQLAFEVVRGMAAVHGNRGDIASAIAHLHRAADMPAAPDAEARHMRCFSAQLEALLGTTSLDEARQRGEQELAFASDVGDVTGQCVALQVLGTVESIAGRIGAAREHLQRAMALNDSGHVRTTSYIIPDLFHAGALLYLDEIEEGLRATDRSRRRHVERGALTQLPLSHMLGAAAHFFTGAWQDADAEIEAGLTVADETGSRNFVLYFRALLARMAIGRGRLDDAAGHIERGFGELASGSLFGADWLFDAHAELQAASGDPAGGPGDGRADVGPDRPPPLLLRVPRPLLVAAAARHRQRARRSRRRGSRMPRGGSETDPGPQRDRRRDPGEGTRRPRRGAPRRGPRAPPRDPVPPARRAVLRGPRAPARRRRRPGPSGAAARGGRRVVRRDRRGGRPGAGRRRAAPDRRTGNCGSRPATRVRVGVAHTDGADGERSRRAGPDQPGDR